MKKKYIYACVYIHMYICILVILYEWCVYILQNLFLNIEKRRLNTQKGTESYNLFKYLVDIYIVCPLSFNL